MYKKLKLIFVILSLIISVLFISCNNKNQIKSFEGLYISFNDYRNALANTMDNQESIKKLYQQLEPKYIYGYNFIFLYIKENGTFYHYFKDRDIISQESTGKASIKENKIILEGETFIKKKGSNNIKSPFIANLEFNQENNILLLKYLDQNKSLEPIYGATGYKKIENIDDIMYLTFNSIKNYNEKIEQNNLNYIQNFEEIAELFRKSSNRIDIWKQIKINGGFYINSNQNNKNFIFIDKSNNIFILYEQYRKLYQGNYYIGGKNLIVYNDDGDFLPFSIINDVDNNSIKAFKNIEGVIFKYYPKLDYLSTMDEKELDSLKNYFIISEILSDIINTQ